MIGFVRGIVADIGPDMILLDHNGLGLRIFMPDPAGNGEIRSGAEIKVYTHLQVREDAMQLYGFLTKDDLEVFRLLLNVSGIGPRGALGVLSVLPADDLRFAVLSEDAAAISKAPGIGKKTAQKLILELKDKFRLDEAFEKKFAHEQAAAEHVSADSTAEADAIEALIALGYSGTEALRAVRRVEQDPSMDSERILKEALKFLF